MRSKYDRSNPHRQELIAQLCEQYPDASNHALARKLIEKYPLHFATRNAADCAVRNWRGNRGESSRKNAGRRGTQRPNGKSGSLPELPKSVAEEWVPFVINARRTLVLSDPHIPYHSELAVAAALDYGDQFKPDAVLINGDAFDYYQISRFDKDPSQPKILAELEAGEQFFAHLRARFRCPIFYKLGNHDERWDLYLQRVCPLLYEIPAVRDAWHEPAGIKKHGVQVIGDQRPVMLGRLPVFHGHEFGKGGIANPVNPARGAFLKTHHTVLVGHSHQSSGHGDTNVWHDETFCWSTGCLCDLTPAYARVNRWNWGFATVEVAKDGSFNVSNLRINKDGKVRTS